MKTVFFTSLLLLAGISAQAQSKLRFGMQAGVLLNDQYNRTSQVNGPSTPGAAPYDKTTSTRYPAPGYLLGGTAQYTLTDRVSLGINVSWYQSGSANNYHYTALSGNNQGYEYTNHEHYRFQYIQLPVWFQYTFASINGHPYLRTGPTYTYLVGPPYLNSTYTNTIDDTERTYGRELPYQGGYGGSFPRHDWQVMTEVGISVSKRVRLGIHYDLLARQRTIVQIGPADGPEYYSFRNRNVGLVTEIVF